MCSGLPEIITNRIFRSAACRARLSLCSPGITPSSTIKWCIRQVECDFSRSGALHGALVRAGEVAMTLWVRALRAEEAPRLARMTRSQKLGAGLVRRAQIIQHAVDGLS